MDLQSMLNDSGSEKKPSIKSSRPSPPRPTQREQSSYSNGYGTNWPGEDVRASPSRPSVSTVNALHDSYFQQPPYPPHQQPTPYCYSGLAQSPAPQGHPNQSPGMYGPTILSPNQRPMPQPGYADRPLSSHSSPPPPPLYHNPPDHSRQDSVTSNVPPQHYMYNRSPLAPPPNVPSNYTRPTQPHRTPSQSYDHYKTQSSNSIGHYGREGSQVAPSPRQYSMERERTNSESVSPKTIPQPLPQSRTASVNSEFPTGPVAFQSDIRRENSRPPSSSTTTPNDHRQALMQPSPGSTPAQHSTPTSVHTPLPKTESPQTMKQATLKRSASVISDHPTNSQPARKRLKRGDIPIFARSARQKPVRLYKVPKEVVTSAPTQRNRVIQDRNGNTNGTSGPKSIAVVPPSNGPELKYEPSITNQEPMQDLTKQICDWIYTTIGMGEPPAGGAVYEIEAKIGQIHDISHDERLDLPVSTETLFNPHKKSGTKFESTMDMHQHKLLNEFLNKTAERSHKEPSRIPIEYARMRQTDEFFDLTKDGVFNLPESVKRFLSKHRKPRVRISTDHDNPGAPTTKIIKTRLADHEIYNPGMDFDYRISISVESPWDGDMAHLVPVVENDHRRSGGGNDSERHKDRVSYRHCGYQIDLTQVSYTNSAKREHELEVEISTELIRQELANIRDGRPNRYMDLVKGFVDNVRILTKQGTIRR